MPASLQPRVFYGLKTDILSNAHYISDAEILYPVGNLIALHNIPQIQQKFLRLLDETHINILALSNNKKFLAICGVGEKPTIAIYDLQTFKRRRLLGIPYDAPDVRKFTCINFSFDSKYLAAVTGEPDQTMLYYNWDKGKVESSIKIVNQNPEATVELLACNPSDNGVVAIGGMHTFKFLTQTETIWRPYGFAKADNIPGCSMAWLNTDRLLYGTKDGRIYYLENGDLKNIYKMSDTVSMNLRIREEYVMPSSGSITTLDSKTDDIDWENNIRCLLAFSKGFAYAYGRRTIIVFERDGQHKYVKRNIYIIPEQISKVDKRDLYKINSMNINLSSDRIIVTSGWPQLFYAKLWGADLNVDPEPQELAVMSPMLHHGPITSVSMCAWKSIFMTCGEVDCSVRLWDFETGRLILLKQYTEDICGIAMHPTGLFCLIGFSDKLRFMSILIDDLLPLEEFPIRCCKTVTFSHGGHLFAAVSENIVRIYTTIGFASYFILKGHISRVKALMWSQTDTTLLTLGSEGAIYQWDMSTGKRSSEIILRGVNLQDIALSIDELTAYCVANDSNVWEIKDNTVREHRVTGMTLHGLILGKEDQAMFFLGPRGIILTLKYPLLEPLQYTEFHAHTTDVSKIVLSYNEQYLVSAGVDGSLCIWKIYYAEGKGTIGKEVSYTNEVLISKGDLEEKIETIGHLNARMREQDNEHTYKMRQVEIQHNDKVRDLHKGYTTVIEELKERNTKLQEDHKSELTAINIEIDKMKDDHEETMKKVELNYHAKLIVEYDRYLALENSMNAMRQDYERRLEELENQRAEEMKKTITKYEALLHEQHLQLEQTKDEMTHQARVHEELTVQIEDDADREILEVRTNYEGLLFEEKELNLRLKGEVGMIQNRYAASQKDVEELKRQVQRVQGEYGYFQKTIADLDKEKENLKKEINDRDDTIQDRERQIYELKRKNQELEKYKFVMNYKITELKNQIEPRDQEIRELKDKIRDMETELVNLHQTTVSLELQLYELREKLKASRHEQQQELHRNKRCRQLLKQICVDLLEASALVQDPHALKNAVMKLYHKYSSADEFLRTRQADVEAQCEFIRQRDHLERTVASLQKQVYHDSSSGGQSVDKMMDDNVVLIVELNTLREQLRNAKRHIAHMEGLLGMSAKYIRPTEAKKKLEKACYGYEELHQKYKTQMQDCQNIIDSLKDDMQKLMSKVPCEEKDSKAIV